MKIDFSEFIIVPNPAKHMTGITGEYFVYAELGKIDILALLTPKNSSLFDVIATNKRGEKYIFISSRGWVLKIIQAGF